MHVQGELERSWMSYFDYMVVDACKPLFFEEGTIMRVVNKARCLPFVLALCCVTALIAFPLATSPRLPFPLSLHLRLSCAAHLVSIYIKFIVMRLIATIRYCIVRARAEDAQPEHREPRGAAQAGRRLLGWCARPHSLRTRHALYTFTSDSVQYVRLASRILIACILARQRRCPAAERC